MLDVDVHHKFAKASLPACNLRDPARLLGQIANWPQGSSWLALHPYPDSSVLLFLICAADQAAPLSPAAFLQ